VANDRSAGPLFAKLVVFAVIVGCSVFLPKAAAIGLGLRVSTQASHQAGQGSAQPGSPKPTEKEVKAYSLPPDKYQQAVEFARSRYWLYFIDTGYRLIVLLAALLWRLAPRFRDLAERSSTSRFVQAVIYAPLLLLALAVVGLPTDLYGHWLSLKYQQSVQGWQSWTWDWIKSQILALLLGTLLIWVLYGIIRHRLRWWWFYFWLVSIPIPVFLLFVEPVVIDPLFYKFEPLQSTHPELVSEISKVVERAQLNIPPSRIFEMRASEKLNSLNAYVTGIGSSKRIVVWDTTIARMTIPQTLTVFGHEMGHYILGHIWKGILFFTAVMLGFLYLGSRTLDWMLRRWGARWEIRGAEDWASLPVLLVLASVFSFLAAPLINGFSRYQEHQADVYELEVIHRLIPNSSQVAAQAEQILGEVDLSDPDPGPFIKFWLYDHPTQKERIEFELHYDPWSRGEKPQFVK